MKRKISFILVLAMVLSFAVTAGAESIAETAKSELKIGKSYTVTVPPMDGSSRVDRKIVMPKDGDLTLSYAHNSFKLGWNLFDENGRVIPATQFTASVGEANWKSSTSYNGESYDDKVLTGGFINTIWNTVSQKAEGEVTYKIDKGTYYIRIARGTTGTSKLSLKVSAKDLNGKAITSEAETATVSSAILRITLNKGETLRLGAVLTPTGTGSEIKWATNKKEVATVSSKGTVKAVAKGSATITMTVDNVRLRIRIVVQE